MATTISTRKGLTVVGGAGHIGLPLAVAFANADVPTKIFDINKEGLREIAKGVFPFKEEGGTEELATALQKGTLSMTTDPKEAFAIAEFIVLVVGTPVDRHLNPDFRGIKQVISAYAPFMHDGQIIILRSTVYPGTSERIQKFLHKLGKRVHVSFCPERIVEGKALQELRTLPQIISAFDGAVEEKVAQFFRKITDRKIIPVKPIEAELAKLYSNAWRYIKFAVGNQFYMLAEDHDLDYANIYKAMTTDYERNRDLPSPGFAAGPCLFKDTMQLSAFSNNKFFLGHAAMLVNEGLPNYILERLHDRFETLSDRKVGILGMTFKAESDDPRDSLSYKLRKLLETHAEEVYAHDHFLEDASFSSLPDLLDQSDIIILATPHRAYAQIDPEDYPDKVFVDIWNFWA